MSTRVLLPQQPQPPTHFYLIRSPFKRYTMTGFDFDFGLADGDSNPLWRRMIDTFVYQLVLILRLAVEMMLPCTLAIVVAYAILGALVILGLLIATACGLYPSPEKAAREAKKRELKGELAGKVAGRAGTGCPNECDELETIRMELDRIGMRLNIVEDRHKEARRQLGLDTRDGGRLTSY
jgi:hypothetical protein